MAKYKNISIDLYKRDITVFIGSHEDFQEWVSSYKAPASWQQLVESIIESDDNALASYWYNRKNGNGIIELPVHPKSAEEIAITAHEVLHCVMHVLSYVGIPCIPHESNEAYTYLMEYLMERVLEYDDYNIINL